MKRTRKTRTTIEKHEVFVIRSYGNRNGVLCPECPECKEPVALITLDEAIRFSAVSSRTIHRLMETARIHFVETRQGMALICPATLAAVVSDATEVSRSRRSL
jgi:hypothetical protein